MLLNETKVNIRFLPREPGVFTTEQLNTLVSLGQEQNTHVRLVLDLPLSLPVEPSEVPRVSKILEEADFLLVRSGKCVKDTKICPECDHGVGNYRQVGRRLNEEMLGLPAAFPLRMSISGCGCMCAMAMLQDIGIVSSPLGYTLYLGGTPYGSPVMGVKVAEEIQQEELVPALLTLIKVMHESDSKLKHLHQLVRRIGIEPFRESLRNI